MPRLKNPGIWAFNALLLIGALLSAGTLARISGSLLPVPLRTPWMILVPITALAELCMFSVRYRSDAQTFSLGEISYVLGVVYLRPTHYLIASFLGLTLAYLIRRERLIRSVFNICATILVACLNVAMTRMIAGDNPTAGSARLWFGVLVGCSLAAFGQAVLVVLVRSIAEHRWLLKEAPKVLLFTQLNGIAISSLGVLIAVVIGVSPILSIVGGVPLLMLYVFCRQLVREHTLRTNVEFLYETAQNIHNTADAEDAFTGLLQRSLTSFHAGFGAVILHRPDSNSWMGFAVGQTSQGRTQMHEAPYWVPEPGQAAIVSRHDAEGAQRLLVDQLGADNLLIASLRIDGATHGVILVADRGGEGAAFGELDRRLFELLAQQVAIGLENSQLERSLGVLTRLEGELRHQANHDALTGLANRSMLTSFLLRADSRGRAVILIDLDDFKTINDSLGHAAGDAVLIEVAKRLRASVREEDLVARLGGDEFAVVLGVRGDSQAATDTAERMSAALNSPMTLDGRRIEVHASIGIATTSDGAPLDELLRSADVAMYQAKSAGKGRHMVFESGMDDEARERMQIVSGLRDAIRDEQFSLVYQPIINLPSNTTVALEALLRWEHHELGVLGPDRFIPMAEESGLIVSLGAWALRRACSDIGPLLSESGDPIALHVNVSPLQVGSADFTEMVIDALSASGMSPNRLVLEITEKTALSDSAIPAGNVESLRELGVKLALDDFGTGYSSLAAAHDFPLDLIKIDQLFVRAIEAGSDASLVRAILAMANSLGLLPVAEGIETAEQRQVLIDLGCNLGQGYLFSPAVALADLPLVCLSGSRSDGMAQTLS